jgi:hypothetical protein
MGCDYYIIKFLYIYYNERDYLDIELDRVRGYYDDQFDEDADDYEEKLYEYIEYTLTPKTEPIIIYMNNKFNKESCELKYKNIVNNKINKHGKKWSEIIKIVKVEERRER